MTCQTTIEPATDGDGPELLVVYRCETCGYLSRPMSEAEARRFAGWHEEAA